MKTIQKILRHSLPVRGMENHPLNNQNGSVIVLVLMVLVTMTVIGIVSSDSIVTENFIIRNVGIHKQNVSLVESALMRGLQEFMQIPAANPANLDVDNSPSDWLNNRNNNNAGDNEFLINTIWYENNFTQRCLNANNSFIDNSIPPLTTLLLDTRGEIANDNLRYAVVGWEAVPGQSVGVGGGTATWRQGRILAEYLSADAGGNDNGFGLLRMEIGVRRQW